MLADQLDELEQERIAHMPIGTCKLCKQTIRRGDRIDNVIHNDGEMNTLHSFCLSRVLAMTVEEFFGFFGSDER